MHLAEAQSRAVLRSDLRHLQELCDSAQRMVRADGSPQPLCAPLIPTSLLWGPRLSQEPSEWI